MKQKLLHNRTTQICAGLLVADFAVFTGVNPRQASAPWLIIGYILLGLTLFGLSSLVSAALKNYGESVHLKAKRLLRYGAAVLVTTVGLQSIGQLTVKDVATLLPLVLLAYLYFGYGKRPSLE